MRAAEIEQHAVVSRYRDDAHLLNHRGIGSHVDLRVELTSVTHPKAVTDFRSDGRSPLRIAI